MKRLLTTLTLTTLLTTTAYAGPNYGTLTPKYPGNDAGTFTNPYILRTPRGNVEVQSKYPGDDPGSFTNPLVTPSGEKLEVRPKYPGNDAGSFTNPYQLRRPLDEQGE